MPNIQFNYFYRDAANYKKYDFVIFRNDGLFGLPELESLIRSKLIDETWFYAEEWKLPELFLDTFDFQIDPTWHEFESVEYADEQPNPMTGLAEFIESIKKTRLPWG